MCGLLLHREVNILTFLYSKDFFFKYAKTLVISSFNLHAKLHLEPLIDGLLRT